MLLLLIHKALRLYLLIANILSCKLLLLILIHIEHLLLLLLLVLDDEILRNRVGVIFWCRNFFSILVDMILLEMVIEMALCGKRPIAAFASAVVRLLSCVESQMCLEISLLEERLATRFKWTDIVTHTIVFLDMDLKSLGSTVRLTTALYWTYIILNVQMSLNMVLEVSFRHE